MRPLLSTSFRSIEVQREGAQNATLVKTPRLCLAYCTSPLRRLTPSTLWPSSLLKYSASPLPTSSRSPTRLDPMRRLDLATVTSRTTYWQARASLPQSTRASENGGRPIYRSEPLDGRRSAPFSSPLGAEDALARSVGGTRRTLDNLCVHFSVPLDPKSQLFASSTPCEKPSKKLSEQCHASSATPPCGTRCQSSIHFVLCARETDLQSCKVL